MSDKSDKAAAKLEHRNGTCSAVSQKNASGVCRCEAFELREHADGFATCACGHTRWSHANTWVPGRNTIVA